MSDYLHMETEKIRPTISEYKDPIEFMREMIQFRKTTEPQFSVMRATQGLRRVSPTLISLILQKKRKITFDRVDELAKLLNLNSAEKFYFKNWLEGLDNSSTTSEAPQSAPKRKDVSISLFSDWLNVYVKDLFKLPKVQKNPDLLFYRLASVAKRKRIEKSLAFLLREGYLRKRLDGRIVVESNLAVQDTGVPNKKVREFHKAGLNLARLAIDQYSTSERLANTATIALNESTHKELLDLIAEFGEKFKSLAEKELNSNQDPSQLYQLIVNLSPIGSDKYE